ncbi:MAG: sporulation transcriptional regulator SpoIIID [Anaeroplasmataceae bacterium]|nr:sporulation transcriptional regulator SpoIIID [Anaeroplasmataceae bacterium]
MEDIRSRVLEMAYLMLDGRRTVREVAKIIGYSKSTVHNDLTTKLEKIDYDVYLQVKELLEYNKKVRHLRGGEATRMKYLEESQVEIHLDTPCQSHPVYR